MWTLFFFLIMHVEIARLLFNPVLFCFLTLLCWFVNKKEKKKMLLFNLHSQILVYYLMCTIHLWHYLQNYYILLTCQSICNGHLSSLFSEVRAKAEVAPWCVSGLGGFGRRVYSSNQFFTKQLLANVSSCAILIYVTASSATLLFIFESEETEPKTF